MGGTFVLNFCSMLLLRSSREVGLPATLFSEVRIHAQGCDDCLGKAVRIISMGT